jgi:hypothetical protein
MLENWAVMRDGLSQMAEFLRLEGIYDHQRLPTNAILAVIAALYADIPDLGDKRGQDELLLKKYLWHSFFTDRYENSDPTNAYADFTALRKIICGETHDNCQKYGIRDVPIFKDHELVEIEELLSAE